MSINPFGGGGKNNPFRLAGIMDMIGLFGMRVFALRDRRTPGSRHVTFYVMPLVLALMMLSWPIVIIFAVLFGVAFLLTRLEADNVTSGLAILGTFAAIILLLAFWRGLRRLAEWSLTQRAEWVRWLVQTGRRPRSVAHVERLIAGTRSVGAITLKA